MAVGTTNPVKLYRKETFSGLFTNSGSFIPKSYKYNLLFTLLHRAFRLCSNFEIFHKEINKLKNVFKSNGYPKSFVDLCIKKYLDQVIATENKFRLLIKQSLLIKGDQPQLSKTIKTLLLKLFDRETS